MWRHLSIAVVAHETVVQRVRSNRWRFNFERARTGGQINFLGKNGHNHHQHQDIYTYNLSVPKGFTLEVPNKSPPYSKIYSAYQKYFVGQSLVQVYVQIVKYCL